MIKNYEMVLNVRSGQHGQFLVRECAMPPAPGKNEVQVSIDLAAFCGSDVTTTLGKNGLVPDGAQRLFHEAVGTVLEVGPGGNNDLIRNQFTFYPYTARCGGTCRACRRGSPHSCRDNGTLGVQIPGLSGRIINVPASRLIPIGELTPRQAVLVEPAAVGLHSVLQLEKACSGTLGQGKLVIIGAGAIGLFAALTAQAYWKPENIILVYRHAAQRQIAEAMGVRTVEGSRKNESRLVAEVVADLGKLIGHDLGGIVEASGGTDTTGLALNLLQYGAPISLVGYAKAPGLSNVTLGALTRGEATIIGSRNATPANLAECVATFQRVANDGFNPASLITLEGPVTAVETLFERFMAGKDDGTSVKLAVSFPESI